MIKSLINFCCLTLISLAFSSPASAIEVVRASIIADGNTHIVDILLFDNDAPVTASNFLNNIDSGSYTDLFINRSIDDFVLQTGGYSFDPTLNDGSFSYAGDDQFNGGLQPVPNVTTIQNEFKLSNLRGTIAMAKSSGETDSNSNEWFINLSDNTFLDASSEGFTVFGKILDNGMEVIDQIAGTPTYDLSADIDFKNAFIDVPLNNYTINLNTNEIGNDNLVKISLTRLFHITDIIDFGDTVAGSAVQKNIVISNTSDDVLDIGIFDADTISPPFNVVSDDCSLTTLLVAEQCGILIEFNPPASGFYQSTANIDIQTYNYAFPIILKTPGPNIDLSVENIDFGLQPVYRPEQGLPEQAVVYINNIGDRDLTIASIDFTSATEEEFEFIDNCTTENNDYLPGKVAPQSFCVLVINFKPLDLFIKTAIISIISDDPDEPEVVINITGGTSTDTDGIDSAIEDASPNNGDGNNDDIPYRLQNNVASFINSDNSYTTLITNTATQFANVAPAQLSALGALPDNITLAKGAFTFEIINLPVGSIVEFGLILPAENSPSGIYSYSGTNDNSDSHWYALAKNTIPGVFIIGDASLTSPSNDAITRNLSTIRILDGGDGDADMTADGKILFVGGAAITNDTSGGTGTMLWFIFFVPLTCYIFRMKNTIKHTAVPLTFGAFGKKPY